MVEGTNAWGKVVVEDVDDVPGIGELRMDIDEFRVLGAPCGDELLTDVVEVTGGGTKVTKVLCPGMFLERLECLAWVVGMLVVSVSVEEEEGLTKEREEGGKEPVGADFLQLLVWSLKQVTLWKYFMQHEH